MQGGEYYTAGEQGGKITRIITEKVKIPVNKKRLLFSSATSHAERPSPTQQSAEQERPTAPSSRRNSGLFNRRENNYNAGSFAYKFENNGPLPKIVS